MSLSIVFALVALILALVEMGRGSFRSLLYWAVVFLALALLSPLLVYR